VTTPVTGSILEGARERGPFAGEGGRTGAAFERAVLADGTPVVIKHASPDDWLMVATGGVNHLDRLWRAGVFDRVPDVIDHTMITIEQDGDGFVLVMRDVSSDVLAEGRVLSRGENRRVLQAMDEMYREFWGKDVPGCPLSRHLGAFTPKISASVDRLDTPIPALMRRGWDMFGDVAPDDVTRAMHAILDDPGTLVGELEKRPSTFIHGDLRLHNMGMTADRVVLLDWEIAGNAPPAVEFGWYLIISASRIDATREQICDDYRETAGDRFDPRAFELGMTTALMCLGWNKTIDILENPDPAIRAQERADLDWWIARVRIALEEWSPI
jgi:phosphotransferase family enzyme